jgi:acyl-CoA thioester hydrolase
MLTNTAPDRDALARLRRDDFSVIIPSSTRWTDNDSYGHINNAVYSVLFDTALDTWLTSIGADGVRVLGMSTIVFLSELTHPSHLEIGISIGSLGTSSVQFSLALFSEGRDRPAAVAAWSDVFVDRSTHRPVPLPEALRTVG